MDQDLGNYFKMTDIVQLCMHEHESSWANTAMVATEITKLDELGIERAAAEEALGNSKIYLSEKKVEFKHNLARKLDSMNDIISVFADFTGNHDLKKRMDKSASDIYSLPDKEFVIEYQTVMHEAHNYAGELSNYGLTQEVINEVEQYGNVYLEIDKKPRLYRTESAKALQKLKNIKNDYHDCLSKLDRLMKIYQHLNPEFYASYKSARVIVDN